MTLMVKLKTTLSRTIHWIRRERLPETIIFTITFPIIYVAVGFYYLKYLLALAENLGYNFEMAILSATLGGFVLVGGFLEKSNVSLRKELINVGRWFLMSAVFSSIFAFVVPLLAVTDKQEHIAGYYLLFGGVAISMLLAIIGFTWGISFLIPCLWRIGGKSSRK